MTPDQDVEDLDARIHLEVRAHFAQTRESIEVPDFEAVLALDPDNAAAHAGLGRLALGERRYGDAIAALERALALDPGADRHRAPSPGCRRRDDL